MSLRPHHDTTGADVLNIHRPEIHHPRPIRPPGPQRRVTIAAETDERQLSTWPHYVPATAALNSEKVAQNNEDHPPSTDATNTQRPPSAPPTVNRPPAPLPLTIHPILTVQPVLRSRPRVRFTWDVRFSPDAPPPSSRRNSTVSNSSTATRSQHSTDTGPPRPRTRPRANTQPADLGPDLQLASNMRSRLNHNYNSHGMPGPSTLEPERDDGAGQTFANHPMALEPATTPPRPRMLIVCRDLLPWLIPIYARDPAVGCTVLDVVRGIYGALQTKVEVAGHMRSASDGTRAERERRRVEWLRDKTVFVCLGRDEALARRRLPGRASLWDEVFVLTVTHRKA